MSNRVIPKIIAHRGASGNAPENTMSAFKLALAASADYIEIDLRLTKDLVPVIIHDPSLLRTAGNSAGVHELPLDSLKTLDAGSWFSPASSAERIPTFAELLAAMDGKTGIMIEIKQCPQPPEVLVDALFKILSKAPKPLPPLKIGSFSPEIVRLVQEQLEQNEIAAFPMGIVEKAGMFESFYPLGLKHIALWYKLTSPSLMQELKDNGIEEAWAFTVDDLAAARFLNALGISGIISNFPQRMQQLKDIGKSL